MCLLRCVQSVAHLGFKQVRKTAQKAKNFSAVEKWISLSSSRCLFGSCDPCGLHRQDIRSPCLLITPCLQVSVASVYSSTDYVQIVSQSCRLGQTGHLQAFIGSLNILPLCLKYRSALVQLKFDWFLIYYSD